MRVGFDAKRAFNNRAGLGNFSRNTINTLYKFHPENEYFLFSPNSNPEYYNVPDKIKTILPEGFWWNTFKSGWRRYHISKLIKEYSIDLYHGLSHELPVGIEFTGIKSVVTIHDLIFIRYPEYYNEADRQIYLKKFRHACEAADRIHAISNQTKNDIIEFFNIPSRKIDVIYQSCNATYYKRMHEEERQKVLDKYRIPKQFLLSVGTIERRKNTLNILKAMLKCNINVPLVIAGRQTKYMLDIDQFIQQNRGKLKVHILTGTTNEELAALYQSAEMLVYPSMFEGFGLPVIEAQASGCPVITSKSSSMPEAGGDGAVYVNPIRETEIGETIAKILNDKDYRKSIIEKGWQNSERFTPEAYIEQLHKLYERVNYV